MIRFVEESIDRTIETFNQTRNSLFSQIMSTSRDNVLGRTVYYKCLMELYTIGHLTARRYKEIENEVYGECVTLFTPLDDIVGWDLRRREIVRSYK